MRASVDGVMPVSASMSRGDRPASASRAAIRCPKSAVATGTPTESIFENLIQV
jgi:hypothetical protein